MSLLKKNRRYSVFYFLASLCLVKPLCAQTYTKEKLEELAVSYIHEQLDPTDADDKQLSALSLDNRIPDRSCDSVPLFTTPTEQPFNRQITVQIKCDDLNSWSQYVHVRMVELSPVVIASENLSRGEVIEAEDLSIIMKPKHFVRAQYLQSKELLIGSRSKRNIRSGYPVALNQICMVCKGDNVSIFATIRGLKIKTSGLALEDGTLGEQVKVKNAKSGKVINARVDAVESVQVII